jgi:hypothetical protein
MSEIKVNKLSPRSGTDITLGNSGTDFIVPSGATITVNSGGQIVNNGTSEGFGIAWQAVTTAATLTTIAGKGYPINTTSNACTVTLPSSASVGDQVQIVDYAGTFATNNITLTSSLNIEGAADDKLLTTNREGVIITYVDATQGWVASSGVNSGDQALDPLPYDIDFLVIAGGGGGGYDRGGGGGAGGYRTSTGTSGGGATAESVISTGVGVVYTITVGAGAAGSTNNSSPASVGIASSIAAPSFSTITSIGGGSGGTADAYETGATGGSGGGSAGLGSPGSTGGTGTANQGYNGGGGLSVVPNYGGGGGGGAGSIGIMGTNTTGGNGGTGVASTITGSSITRAGGGGGGVYGGGTGGTGGSGGGGTATYNAVGANGTINTGSGGGGGSGNPALAGGNGGAGVVILSMPLANFSNTVTGSPTESDDGTTKILIFNNSGSYTS